MQSRDERVIRENGGAELLDDPQFAAYCRLVAGKLTITTAGSHDYTNRSTRQTAAPRYHLIAMILIRTAGNFLERWQAAGHKLNHTAYNTATKLYTRAAFAMRQATNAALYAGN